MMFPNKKTQKILLNGTELKNIFKKRENSKNCVFFGIFSPQESIILEYVFTELIRILEKYLETCTFLFNFLGFFF